jgi:hypothetical protein
LNEQNEGKNVMKKFSIKKSWLRWPLLLWADECHRCAIHSKCGELISKVKKSVKVSFIEFGAKPLDLDLAKFGKRGKEGFACFQMSSK